jgi:flagellar basal-body rod modification protein FlgD
MTSSIGSVTQGINAGGSGSTAAAANKTALDKDSFLKLLVAQIAHQDPLSPMQGTEFVSQLSQFAMVEQSIAQTSRLDTLSTQIGGVANNEATSLVGKRVSLRGHALMSDGITASSASLTLSAPTSKMTVDIVDSSGKVVRTINIGPHPAGVVPITWDGKDSSGQSVPKGTYTLAPHASAADGSKVQTTQDVVGTVMKITFDKGYPEITLDNGAVAPISDLVGVEAPLPPKAP